SSGTRCLRSLEVGSLGGCVAWLISYMDSEKIGSTRCRRLASRLKADPAIMEMLILPMQSILIPLTVAAASGQVWRHLSELNETVFFDHEISTSWYFSHGIPRTMG